MSDRRTFLTTLAALLASAGLPRAAAPARRDGTFETPEDDPRGVIELASCCQPARSGAPVGTSRCSAWAGGTSAG